MARLDMRMICYYLSLFVLFKIGMEDPDPKTRQQLAAASDHFAKKEYPQARKVLTDIKATHVSSELNALLCEYKENPSKIASVARKIMDILVAVNIKIYKNRPQQGKKRNPKISHEFYFWNIIVLSQLMPNPEITELIANEALHFVDSLRTETSLMIIYQMLTLMAGSGRLASCISLIEKQNRLIENVKKLTPQEQAYRFMNQILFCKVLLKLGMIDGGRIMYMMKFNQNLDEPKEEELMEINGLHIAFHQQFLRAEIEYHAENYQAALKILAQLLPKVEKLGKNKDIIKSMIDHNVGLILVNYKKTGPGKLMISKALNCLAKEKELECNNERAGLISKCRDNLMIASLPASAAGYSMPYEALKTHHNCYSYKLNYRKAELCLNFYHELIKNPSRVLPYKEIHDFYETVYYYPNLPYFQQKGKNKNPNYSNGKVFYRRYILEEGQYRMGPGEVPQEEDRTENVAKKANVAKEVNQVKKEPSREKRTGGKKKGSKKEQEKVEKVEKQEIFVVRQPENKLKQILQTCEWYLKQALVVLQKQKSIIVNLQDEQKGLTQQVNEKLYSEYITFKSSIYSLLCYIYLCKFQWEQTVYYATLYQSFEKQYQLQSKGKEQHKASYNIMTYKMEAYCQLNRMDKNYDLLHELVGLVDYQDSSMSEYCAGAVQESGKTYFEQMSQYNNFGFNLSVLHSKDNKIPEAYNSIQKLLQQMREIPTNPKANLPLSVIQLLMHYNLRTGNQLSALQLIKRRRILNLPGVIGHYNPTLDIAK